MLDWNDLQYLLAIGRNGSMKGAARALKTDPTTVSRHVKKLTEVTKSTLVSFERDGTWSLTGVGEQLIELAGDIDERINDLLMSGSTRSQNSYTISTLEFVAESYLAPHLEDLGNQMAGTGLAIESDERRVSLAYGEADLALRLSRPTDGKLVVSKLGRIEMGVFSPDNGRSRDWIGLSERYDWTPEMVLGLDYFGRAPAIRLGSYRGIREASKSTGLSCIGPSKTMSHFQRVCDDSGAHREVWSAIHESRKHDEALASIRGWARRCFDEAPATA